MAFRLHRKIAHMIGYKLIHFKKLNHLMPDLHLKTLLNHLQIDCVIDVGANKGQYALLLRSIGYQGLILSIEPLKNDFVILQAKSKHDEKWHVYNFAFGVKNEKLEINVTRGSHFSSFHKPNELSQQKFPSGAEVIGHQLVEVQRLDHWLPKILPEIQATRLFLKMDTQGHDLEVFKGAEKILNHIIGLQSEMAVTPIYNDIGDYIQALSTYRKAGFEVTGSFPISRDHDNLVIIEYDCFMRKLNNT